MSTLQPFTGIRSVD